MGFVSDIITTFVAGSVGPTLPTLTLLITSNPENKPIKAVRLSL